MVGVLGKDEVSLFFRLYPHKILMRGHSHQPELIQSRHKTIISEGLKTGEILQIPDIVPGILTCGAADHGFVMIWDRIKQTIGSYKL